MSYQGVKFKTEFVSGNIPDDERIERLKYWCNQFHLHNLAPSYQGGSFGNLSFRFKDGCNDFIITGAKTDLGDNLANNCFVKVESCNFEDRKVYVSGTREPSSESMLHFAIYNRRKDVNAIFHGHCQLILCNADKLQITETAAEQPYGSIELVESVLDVLDDKFFLVMKNHGFICMAKDMEHAGEIAFEALEKISNKDS